jgi:hypothetical protein
LAAGCGAFLPKPVRVEQLLQLLQLHLVLEWDYEKNTGTLAEQPIASATPEKSLSCPDEIAAPPAEQLAALFQQVIRGDIRALLERTAKIEQLDEKFAPVQRKQRREFLKQYMRGDV